MDTKCTRKNLDDELSLIRDSYNEQEFFDGGDIPPDIKISLIEFLAATTTPRDVYRAISWKFQYFPVIVIAVQTTGIMEVAAKVNLGYETDDGTARYLLKSLMKAMRKNSAAHKVLYEYRLQKYKMELQEYLENRLYIPVLVIDVYKNSSPHPLTIEYEAENRLIKNIENYDQHKFLFMLLNYLGYKIRAVQNPHIPQHITLPISTAYQIESENNRNKLLRYLIKLTIMGIKEFHKKLHERLRRPQHH